MHTTQLLKQSLDKTINIHSSGNVVFIVPKTIRATLITEQFPSHYAFPLIPIASKKQLRSRKLDPNKTLQNGDYRT